METIKMFNEIKNGNGIRKAIKAYQLIDALKTIDPKYYKRLIISSNTPNITSMNEYQTKDMVFQNTNDDLVIYKIINENGDSTPIAHIKKKSDIEEILMMIDLNRVEFKIQWNGYVYTTIVFMS